MGSFVSTQRAGWVRHTKLGYTKQMLAKQMALQVIE
jgi:hypothetical protein